MKQLKTIRTVRSIIISILHSRIRVSDYEVIDVGTTAEEEREKRGEASA